MNWGEGWEDKKQAWQNAETRRSVHGVSCTLQKFS